MCAVQQGGTNVHINRAKHKEKCWSLVKNSIKTVFFHVSLYNFLLITIVANNLNLMEAGSELKETADKVVQTPPLML